jgi:hypothetical protein
MDIGTIALKSVQRRQFQNGDLREAWAESYPQLFDELDLAQARNQPQYHFYEWLSAIVLHHSTGYLSLVGKYQFGKHERKRAILEEVVSPETYRLIVDHPEFGTTQPPDLLMYAPDRSDYFFCEVKGPGDRLRSTQRDFFDALREVSGKPIHMLRLREHSL